MVEEDASFLFESKDNDYDSSSSISTASSIESSFDTENQKQETIEEIIHGYSETDFRKHFRLHRSTVQTLIDRYRTSDNFYNREFPKILPEKEIFMFLWYMANTNTFQELSYLSGVTKSIAWNTVNRVSAWLISIGHNYVKWPNENEAMQNATIFEERTKIPGVLGCIGGTYIRIKIPLSNRESYYNSQKFYSVTLQGVVDPNKKFMNIFAGEPGNLNYTRVLRRSGLYRDAYQNMNALFPNNTFLLGDSEYPCLDWLVPPFKDKGVLGNIEKQFNALHSAGHVVVEHSFEILKNRFRRLLHFSEQTDINFIVNLVVCGCILHNMCIELNDELDADENVEEIFQNPDDFTTINPESTKPQQLLDDLIRRKILRI